MATDSNQGLTVEVGITLNKLQRQMASAEARMVKAAKKMEGDFARANTGTVRSFQSADTAAHRFANGGLRGVSMQLSQVAQQGAATGNYLQALALQAPDLALGFGAVGVAAGALIPILFGVAQAAMGAEEEIEKIDVQGAYSSATTALEAAREAQDRYTAAIRLSGVAQSEITPAILGQLKLEAQAREALAALEVARLGRQRLALQEALEESQAQLDSILEKAATGASVGVFQLSDAEVAQRVAQAIEVARAANEDLVLSIQEQQAELDLVNSLIEQGHGEAAVLVDQLLNAATNADGVASAAGGISFEGGVASALRLAEALGISLERARLLALTQANMRDAKEYSGRGGDPRQFMDGGSQSDYQSSLDYTPVSEHIENLTPKLTTRKSGGSGKSGRSGGGGKSEAEREADREENRLLSERDRILRGLETPMEEYQRQLADLNRLQAMGEITGEKYNAALAKLDEELMRAEFGAIIDGIESVADAMSQAIVNGEDMGEALGNVFKGIAADLLSSGIREAMMSVLGSGGGGGGLWGTILSAFGGGGARADGSAIAGALGSAISGARAAGGPVRAGEAYRVNEHTPNSEIFVPSRSGAILNASHAQRALAGATRGGGRTEIVVRHEPGTVVEIARGEANNVYVQREPGTVGKAVKNSQASIPAYLNEHRDRYARR